MAKIRKIEIRNFRAIKSLDWFPTGGINCLIGPGDSGKSTVLDAIDLCLGLRRSVQLSDTDFFALDVSKPICISLTLGDLNDSMKSIETYGLFLRSFNAVGNLVEDEPRHGWETVLTVNFEVSSDLEPEWFLTSLRPGQEGVRRNFAWKDRLLVAPTRLGNHSSSNLSWARGSVLNRLSDERVDLGSDLVNAAREARTQFGEQAGAQLGKTLKAVSDTAKYLGVSIGSEAKALLDASAISFGDGVISLHSETGIPLKNLGTGSTRLLIAGLQRMAAQSAAVLLVDELEYGLEPHRLTRFLDSLGAKDAEPPLQAFMTTHSPVALRELAGKQLFVLRGNGEFHSATEVGNSNDIQATIRKEPEAFLATSVVVCEGASEVGFIRGLDAYRISQGAPALASNGVAYVDTGGGTADKCFEIGLVFQKLGYRVMVLVDSDKPQTKTVVDAFVTKGGKVASWRKGRALEDELFLSLPEDALEQLIDLALEFTEEGLVDAHIRTTAQGKSTLDSVRVGRLLEGYTPESRALLGASSRIRRAGWFKSITKMERVAREVIGPSLAVSDAGFQAVVEDLLDWAQTRA